MLPAAIALLCLTSQVPATVIGMDGKTHHPVSEAGGIPVALVFISHDCPICNGYAPEICRLAKQFKGKAAVELIYAEPDLSPAQANKHAKEYGLLSVPRFLDGTRLFAESCGATVTPQAIVYNELGKKVWSGRIDDRYVRIGIQRNEATTHDLRSAVDAIVHHRQPKPAAGGPVGCFILKPGIS